MDWLEKFFLNYPKHLKPPAQFMNEDGKTIDMEWDEEDSPLVICLDVHLDSHKAEGFTYYSDTPKASKLAWSIRGSRNISYDLDSQEDVVKLFELIGEYGQESNEREDLVVVASSS